MRTEDGGILIDGRQTASTRQCGHCGAHFQMVAGSGRVRGWCLKCSKITCGAQACHPCIPMEARLEFWEGKRNPKYDDTIRDLIAEGAALL